MDQNYPGNPYPPQPPQRSFGCMAFALIGVLALFVCCGGPAGVIWFGMRVVTKEVELILRDNPVLVQHVGQVENFELDWSASFAHPDDDVFIYQVQGTKGSGEITAKTVTDDDGNEEVEWARLRLSNGETVDLIEE